MFGQCSTLCMKGLNSGISKQRYCVNEIMAVKIKSFTYSKRVFQENKARQIF